VLDLKAIKSACGHITLTDERGFPKAGTGYLIAADRAATCAHVVDNAETGNIQIDFGGKTRQVWHVRINKESDCAVLTLSENIVGVTPLKLGECEWNAAWHSYGFPAVAKGAGLTMSGVVSDPDARDDLKAAVLELTSPEVAAGMAAPIHGFSGSPVIVNDVVVGHLKRFLSDPNEPTRPAYGKVYATRSECVHDLLLEDSVSDSTVAPLVASPPSPVQPPKLGSEEYASQHRKILQLLEEWSTEDMPPGKAVLVASESLIQLGEPDEALKVLNTVPMGLRNEQLRALALAKIGEPDTLDESILILEKLRQEGHFDAETGGLLGGRYKQEWQRSGDSNHLRKSHTMYLDTFKVTRDPYPGINAAATALWLKDKSTSEYIARQILEMMNDVSLESTDGWALATKGEATLLTGDAERAKQWYAQAAKRFNYGKGAIEAMRSQAQLNLKALGLKADAMEDVFLDKEK
jgi:hypothetical protein